MELRAKREELFRKMECAYRLMVTARQLGVDDLARKEEFAYNDYLTEWDTLLLEISDIVKSTSTPFL